MIIFLIIKLLITILGSTLLKKTHIKVVKRKLLIKYKYIIIYVVYCSVHQIKN